ncbi:hypothetical protein HWV07_05875 [Natronomonas salina]|uniref:hypothetical protein n=1 Tax=Natronomonas salina TaxID=1710540 RepID=UPI0015B412AA|nr:hypothetical protein [Natronomonas salina]QLD88585.1 hypothetical protein HWV07_05875 [Natronomonas salina]
MNRRALLSSLGALTVSGLSGCSSSEEEEEQPPAGSVRFSNRHDLPHVVGFTITNIGTEIDHSSDDSVVTGDTRLSLPIHKKDLSTSVSIAPDETSLYPGAFSKRASDALYYAVEFSLDGSVPERGEPIPFSPAPSDDERCFLEVSIGASGSLSPGITKTENEGEYS